MSRNSLNNIVLIAATHRWVSPRELSRLYLDQDYAYRRLSEIADERFVFQTCHRVEFYLLVNDGISPERVLRLLYSDASSVLSYFRYFVGEDAVKHLLRVASGLDSAILGECEVLGQLETAYDYAARNRHIRDVLRLVIERAIRFGKLVRTTTGISRGVTGFGSLTVLYLKKLYQILDDLRILIIGAGEMGATLAKELHDAGAKHVIILNRTIEKAKELADKYGYKCDFLTKENLIRYLQEVDVAIFAVSVREPLLRGEDISQLRRRPLIIDLGMPHNVDDNVDTAAIWLEDLAKLAEKYNREKLEEAKKIEELIEKELENIISELRKKTLKNLLSQYIRFINNIATRELDKAIARGVIRPEDRDNVSTVIRAVTNKAVRPLVCLVEEYSKQDPEQISKILRDLTRFIKEEFEHIITTSDENGSRRQGEEGPKR